MSELERRLRATAHAASTAASSARAPQDIKRSITRRRRLTLGSAGVAAAVVIGSVAVGGLGLTDTPELPSLTPTASADLSLDRGTVDYTTVPLSTTGHLSGELMQPGSAMCGESAPAPSHDNGDFTATFELPDKLELDRSTTINEHSTERASITLAYNAQEPLPAFAGGLTALFIEDDVVVGYSNSSQPAVVNTFMPDQTRTYPWRWDGWVTNCDTSDEIPYLPAGDYDVVWISRVHNDLTTAAQWSLQQDNYSLPTVQDLEAFREGSFFCDQWHMMDTFEPITCNPNALVGFTLDEEENTATIPYDTSYYVRDVDVLFVSAPSPAALTGEYPDMSYGDEFSIYEPGGEMVCGDFFHDIARNDAQLSGMLPSWSRLPAPGETVSAHLWRWALGWSEAHVNVPASSRIWLTQHKVAKSATEKHGASVFVTYHGHEVVGWLDVESATAPSVQLQVYDGPAEWPLTVIDAGWCDGHDPSAPHSALMDFGFRAITSHPATVTLDDGTHYEDVVITLSPDHVF